MWAAGSRVGLLGLAVVGFVFGVRHSGRRQLAELVTVKVGLPEEAADWMLPGAPRWLRWGCSASLALFALTIVTLVLAGPWQRAVVLGVAAGVAPVGGAVLGAALAKLRGDVSVYLREFADAAARRAVAFGAAGDTAGSESALELARWIGTLCQHVPNVTRETLERYYTPFQVATIMENWFFEGDDDWEIRRWLETPATAFYVDPREDDRIALIEQARGIVQPFEEEPRGLTDDDQQRLREMIARLRRHPRAAS